MALGLLGLLGLFGLLFRATIDSKLTTSALCNTTKSSRDFLKSTFTRRVVNRSNLSLV